MVDIIPPELLFSEGELIQFDQTFMRNPTWVILRVPMCPKYRVNCPNGH